MYSFGSNLYETFGYFTQGDIKGIVDQLCEVETTDCAVNYIYNQTNRFRQIVKLINKAENIAKANGLKGIDELTLKEFINDDPIKTVETCKKSK